MNVPIGKRSHSFRAKSSIAQYGHGLARTRCYQDGVLTDADFDADQLSVHLEESGCVVWVDLVAPNADELALIADELGLHALAVEDAIYAHQRACHEPLLPTTSRVDPG